MNSGAGNGGWTMNTRIRIAGIFACGLLMTSWISAQTAEEEEAHISALISAELAGQRPPAPAAGVSGAEPAPVIAEVFANPQQAEHDWLAPPGPQDTGLAFAELEQYRGRRVTIVTTGERVHRGIVSSATPRAVTLSVRRAGGLATYTLQKQQIVRIELR